MRKLDNVLRIVHLDFNMTNKITNVYLDANGHLFIMLKMITVFVIKIMKRLMGNALKR